ncbi:MAG: HAD-IIB family hydrolase [Deltaproteobacteria bacterium]|nr:HAD-IIB family hydrolase [Deltaproteobacteria bacterium]
MLPISRFPAAVAVGLRAVFTDIDGTLTAGGRVTAEAFAALWKLASAGVRVVAVTGRPAGWCDALVRQWPIDAVIGENGALAFYLRQGRVQRLFHPSVAREGAKERLAAIRDEILAAVSGSRVAADQAYRLYDLAIDFAEEPPDLGLDTAEEIRGIFLRHGAHAKVSSIHVNGWFGDYDKLAMTKLYAREVWRQDLDAERERYTFVGDSANDEPMFAHFPHACAVANVRAFATRLAHQPRYVSAKDGGAGFAEIAATLLRLRKPPAKTRSKRRRAARADGTSDPRRGGGRKRPRRKSRSRRAKR